MLKIPHFSNFSSPFSPPPPWSNRGERLYQVDLCSSQTRLLISLSQHVHNHQTNQSTGPPPPPITRLERLDPVRLR